MWSNQLILNVLNCLNYGSTFALILDRSLMICNQTVCGVGELYLLWLPMCYIPDESYWGETNCN